MLQSPVYNMSFYENGLPSGTQWGVTLNGTGNSALAPNAILFYATNAVQQFPYVAGNSVFGNSIYVPVPANGTVAANSSVVIGFTQSMYRTNAIISNGNAIVRRRYVVEQQATERIIGNLSQEVNAYITGVERAGKSTRGGLGTSMSGFVNVSYNTTSGENIGRLITEYVSYNDIAANFSMETKLINISYSTTAESENVATSYVSKGSLSPIMVNVTAGPLRDIYVKASRNFSNVSTAISYSGVPPQNVPMLGSGAYSYIQINSTIPDSSVNQTKYVFSVNATWLTAMGISPGQVTLYRRTGSAWVALPTTEIGSNGTAYAFSAFSPSFSTYAVGFASGSVAGDASPESVTLASGYPLYLCGGGANYTFDGTAPSWTQDKWAPGTSFTLASTNASLGHQESDICEAYTTGASNPGLAIAGIGVNAIYYSFTGTSGSGAASGSLSYSVAQTGSYTVIVAAAGYYDLSAVTPPTGCTQQQFKSNADTYESAYIATCPLQPAGSNSVSVTLSSSGSYAIGAYVFPPRNVIFDDVPANGKVLTNGTQQPSGSLVQTLGTGTMNAIDPPGNYVFWQWTTSNSLNATVANARSQNTVLTVEGNAVVTADYNGITLFMETGLPASTLWSVTYDGFTNTSTTQSIYANTLAGTYSYTIPSVSGYTPTPASGTVIANGVVNIVFTSSSPTCTIDVSDTAINFGSISPGSSVNADNAVTDTNTGTATAYMSVSGGSWSVVGAAPTYYVSNTFYGNTLVSGITPSVGFPLSTSVTNTLLSVPGSGSNTIFFGTKVPALQKAGTYNQIITVENTC
jgi:PGF-pre-PGF domain-containing protein